MEGEEERARECTRVWIAAAVILALVALFIFIKLKSDLREDYHSLFDQSSEEED